MPVVTRGPFFDSRRTRFTDEFCEDLAREVAEHAETLWKRGMIQSFKQPTPIYWHTTQVITSGNTAVTNDGGRTRGLVYGPWLEGVGSRNKTTRFKGYFNLRKAASQTRTAIRRIATPLLRGYYSRMNGGL